MIERLTLHAARAMSVPCLLLAGCSLDFSSFVGAGGDTGARDTGSFATDAALDASIDAGEVIAETGPNDAATPAESDAYLAPSDASAPRARTAPWRLPWMDREFNITGAVALGSGMLFVGYAESGSQPNGVIAYVPESGVGWVDSFGGTLNDQLHGVADLDDASGALLVGLTRSFASPVRTEPVVMSYSTTGPATLERLVGSGDAELRAIVDTGARTWIAAGLGPNVVGEPQPGLVIRSDLTAVTLDVGARLSLRGMAVDADTVFVVGDAEGDPRVGFIAALDRADLSLQWARSVSGGRDVVELYSTAVFDDRLVVVGTLAYDRYLRIEIALSDRTPTVQAFTMGGMGGTLSSVRRGPDGLEWVTGRAADLAQTVVARREGGSFRFSQHPLTSANGYAGALAGSPVEMLVGGRTAAGLFAVPLNAVAASTCASATLASAGAPTASVTVADAARLTVGTPSFSRLVIPMSSVSRVASPDVVSGCP